MTQARVRSLTLVTVVALAATARPSTSAPDAPVIVVKDDDSRPYQAAVDGVVSRAPDARIFSVTHAGLDDVIATSPVAAVIALGPRAAALVGKLRTSWAASALVRADDAPAHLPVVDLEVALATQAQWMARAFPGRTRVIVPRKRGGNVTDDDVTKAAEAAGLMAVLVDVDTPRLAVFALERALRVDRADALVWLLPDPHVVAGDTVAALVEVTVAARVPLIGFSNTFLKAGALAALRTDFTQMGAFAVDVARTANAIDAVDGKSTAEDARALRRRHDPPGARLVVNARLAEKLGIAVGSGKGVELMR